MTMPKWHETMRPVLEALEAAPELLKSSELMEVVAKRFNMTDAERAERLNSGQPRLHNRTYWGITDLEKAKLLEYGTKRGTYSITDAGRAFLESHDGPITAKDLYEKCTPFRVWKDGYKLSAKGKALASRSGDSDSGEQVSPQDAMDDSYREIREALADELVKVIMGKDPYFFEYLVGRVLNAMGYGNSEEGGTIVTKKSGDEGIDGVVKEDRLGFDAIYYQAKRWDPSRTVGRPDVQAFSGAFDAKGATKGLFMTTAHFSNEAREYVVGLAHKRIVLVDGRALANLMIDYGVGVSTRAVYEVKAVDTDFFEDV